MKFESNEELKEQVKNGVLDCRGEDLICDFNIEIEADIINADYINARDIYACDINARDINAWDIDADDIYACDITAYSINAGNIFYYAVCWAYQNIKCESIKGRRENSKHFCLDGEITIKEKEECERE